MDTDVPPDVPHVAVPAGGQVEITAGAGGVVNDTFVKTPLVVYGVVWHVNDLLAVEVHGASNWLLGGSNDCDDPRWKPITCDVWFGPVGRGGNPEFHYLAHRVHAGVSIAPLRGTLLVGDGVWLGFAVYVRAGFGAAKLAPEDPLDPSGLHRPYWVPTTDVAQGVLIAVTPRVALRAELRRTSYIERDHLSLDLERPLIGQGGVSVVLGRGRPEHPGG